MKYTDKIASQAYQTVSALNSYKDVASETLEAALQYADKLRFYAEMSDDYSVTRKERAEIAKNMRGVRQELQSRNVK